MSNDSNKFICLGRQTVTEGFFLEHHVGQKDETFVKTSWRPVQTVEGLLRRNRFVQRARRQAPRSPLPPQKSNSTIA